MLKSKYSWKTKCDKIVSNVEIFPTLLKNRNIDDYEKFFSMREESLIDPYLLNDIEKAKKRILLAISKNESIMIFGDYDCDGICSISILYRALKKLNANVYYDLPNRFIDGYALNMRAVKKIIDMDVSLVITVDNGVTCVDEVEELNKHGIDTIITDHHTFGDKLPNALAIIHTYLSKDYSFKEIAGVMVAYKLAKVLIGDEANEFYDLAMIGTVADLMPLKEENQAMVNLGLERLKKTKNLGLKKIIEFSNLDVINLTAISFKIAPKINSSGRLGKALDAVRLLVTEDTKEAYDLIMKIEKNHASRKKLTEQSFEECEKLVNPDDKIIVVASKNLHEGVIGICAQKIVEKYQKPTIVINIDEEGIGKGSVRSYGDLNILNLLHQEKNLLIRYGGHSQAAGLQLKAEDIDKFRKGLNDIAKPGKTKELIADMRINLADIEIATIQDIQNKSFFTASFLIENVRIVSKQILGYKHTKLIVECHGVKFDALHFNSLEYYYSLENGDIINLIAGLNVNNYRNRRKIQLMIKDIDCKDFQVLNLRDSENLKNEIKWIKNDFFEINDKVILENDFTDYIDIIMKWKTLVITPYKLHTEIYKITRKNELRKVYQLLREIHEFKLDILLKRIEFHQHIFKYAIKIFIELNLIKKNDDYYVVKDEIIKTDLHNSKTYVRLEKKNKLIELIYFDYNSHIKSYFNKYIKE